MLEPTIGSEENMDTTWRTFGEDPLSPLQQAALGVIAAHGYHGASIRMIAEAASLSVPGLYHHYLSKQAILASIVQAAMEEMLSHTRAAAAEATDARSRFDNIVEALMRFHLLRRTHAFVASTEMRSMAPEIYAHHVAQRDEQQQMISDAIRDGIATGQFICAHPKDAARAVSSLCVSTSDWYRADGPLSADEIVERYLDFARAIAGAQERAPGR